MKAKLLKLVTLPLLFATTSCGGYTFVGCIRNETPSVFRAEYKSFDGKHDGTLNVKNDGAIKVAIVTTSGKLSVTIQNNATNDIPYVGNIEENMNFDVNVVAGKYTITLNAINHSGSYSFTCE